MTPETTTHQDDRPAALIAVERAWEAAITDPCPANLEELRARVCDEAQVGVARLRGVFDACAEAFTDEVAASLTVEYQRYVNDLQVAMHRSRAEADILEFLRSLRTGIDAIHRELDDLQAARAAEREAERARGAAEAGA